MEKQSDKKKNAVADVIKANDQMYVRLDLVPRWRTDINNAPTGEHILVVWRSKFNPLPNIDLGTIEIPSLAKGIRTFHGYGIEVPLEEVERWLEISKIPKDNEKKCLE